ncbi:MULTISPECIES: DUF6081 family protein [unclassified Streptomyces]|uniref:DUF6081 family protein n=1 Tax=unclassified Streptomyces TaxID=2593676 RepID=UPI002E78240A|nr:MULTISPECIES: DUF6081 family protein [unclassified Streptomyces]MEE1758254.1 DUF6081 family protein [Streptomyces sp. SP18BB07]MEE1832690.1 DUF6081 family protein [Streptomyces sp. SP17KL33]
MGHGVRRRRAVVVTALLIALAQVGSATADEQAQTVFSDNFQSGFNASPSGSWQQLPAGSLPEGDGITSTSSTGLKVVPSGTDPATGKPAFAYTTGQQSAGGQGDADHLKWLAWPRRSASSGYPGFDAPAAGKVSCTTKMAVETTGTDKHPFGSAVSNAQTDLRLASGAMVTLDPETNVVFDFFVTNNRVYAFYERLRSPGSTYAAFSYAVPVATMTKGTQLTYEIVLENRSRATWKVNGATVLTVNKIGTRALDRKYMLIDHGGTEETVVPRQLQCAVGTFSLLDGAGADGRGLVRLDSDANAYYKPMVGAPAPQTFVDDKSLAGNRLWGQGAQLQVSSFTVTSD